MKQLSNYLITIPMHTLDVIPGLKKNYNFNMILHFTQQLYEIYIVVVCNGTVIVRWKLIEKLPHQTSHNFWRFSFWRLVKDKLLLQNWKQFKNSIYSLKMLFRHWFESITNCDKKYAQVSPIILNINTEGEHIL